MDYRRAMGVKSLSKGDGVRIAILDSGTPPPIFNNEGRVVSIHAPESSGDDESGHATAIGSILWGGDGIRGLCEHAEPVYIKVLDSQGCGTIESVSKGIYSAINEDVDLINLSLGFVRTERCPEAIEKACKAAFEAKIPIFCAAGNDGGPVKWPAALKNTICVGATDKKGQKMGFSSSGEVDFVAPGVDLPVFGLDGRIKMVSGTSFAVAVATGMAALLIPELRKVRTDKVGMERLYDALRQLAVDIESPGWDEGTGFGLILGDGVNIAGVKIKTSIFGTIISKVKSLFLQKTRS